MEGIWFLALRLFAVCKPKLYQPFTVIISLSYKPSVIYNQMIPACLLSLHCLRSFHITSKECCHPARSDISLEE